MVNETEMMGLVGEFVDALAQRLQLRRREPIILRRYQDEKNYCAVFDETASPSSFYDATVLHASLTDGKIYLRGENNAAPVEGAFLSYDFSQAGDVRGMFGQLAIGFSNMTGVSVEGASLVKDMPSLAI
ncbi:MAG: hypothetical protein WC043_01345 [Pseudobdellovibrionaceae bacterium]